MLGSIWVQDSIAQALEDSRQVADASACYSLYVELTSDYNRLLARHLDPNSVVPGDSQADQNKKTVGELCWPLKPLQ